MTVSTTSYLIIFCAVLLPAAIYFHQAFKEMANVHGLQDFFPIRRVLGTSEYRSTTLAAGMSLATVIIAFINLAPMLGTTLFASVISYPLGFMVVLLCAKRIMEANPDNETIQAFLGKSFQNKTVRNVALLFSLIGYLSIFSMELLVGVTVLEPFLKEYILLFAIVYLVFLIAYTIMSGFRAIVATDRWQLRFIIMALGSLVLFGIVQSRGIDAGAVDAALTKVGNSFIPMWPFILGIFVMNLTGVISDAGSWQRLCSTRNHVEARRGIWQSALFFGVLWSILILFGCYYGNLAVGSLGYDPTKGQLVPFLMTQMAGGGLFLNIILFMFILGLFSAMISTADSILIVAGQIISIDIMGLQPSDGKPALKKARIAMSSLAVIAFTIFSVLYLINFDVVQLVFAIGGSQLAMFPALVAALFFKRFLNMERAKYAAIASIFAGYSGGWGCAIAGKALGSQDLLFYAPPVALGIGVIVFVVCAIPALQTGNDNGKG